MSSAAIMSQLVVVVRNISWECGKYSRTHDLFKKVSLFISLQTLTARTGNTLGFTGGVENCFACLTPRGGVKLKRKNDVVHVADLADEASLSAEVAMMHVLAGELDERLQEGLVLAVRYLPEVQHAI